MTPDQLLELARQALAERREAAAVTAIEAQLPRSGDDPRLWRMLGHLHRACDESAAALAAFDTAAALAPRDPAITGLRASTRLDAGLSAVDGFDAALRLDPGDGEMRLGLAAALVADGRAGEADALIEQALELEPDWAEGHDQLAKLRWMAGDPDHCRGFDAALASGRAPPEVWRRRITLAMQAGSYAEALDLIAAAEAATGPAPLWLAHRAACLDEQGEAGAAAAAFAELGPPGDAGLAVRLARHQLRTGQAAAAAATCERWLATDFAHLLWPYAALAWRSAGDRRWAWLEGQQALVGVYDLAPELGDLAALADRLRGLHRASRQPIDQSLRRGTQTAGYLLARIEPEFRRLREALVAAVAGHIAQLPPRDPFHPVLRHERDRPVRFSGSWSVRLAGGGRHANHVHPGGWFSSALYLAQPDADPAGDPHAGWLVLGEAEDELGLGLPPLRLVEPRPGRLVLFPSTLWHGTRPFGSGERLTVAFDVAGARDPTDRGTSR